MEQRVKPELCNKITIRDKNKSQRHVDNNRNQFCVERNSAPKNDGNMKCAET